MRVIKKLLIFFLFIVVVFLIGAFFLPEKYTVVTSTVIDKPIGQVYKNIADFNLRMKWNPWSAMEPSAKFTIMGEQGEVGASWEWKGEEIGWGKQTLTKVEKNKYVESKLEFFEPWEDVSKNYYELEKLDGGKTKVTWGMEGNAPYPTGRWMMLFMKGQIKDSFDKGLAKLKTILE